AARRIVCHGEIEELVVRHPRTIDHEAHVQAPASGVGGPKDLALVKPDDRSLCGRRAGTRRHAYDNRVGAAILEELLDRHSQRAFAPQPAKLAFIIAERRQPQRLVERATPRAANKGRDRGRHAFDWPDAAGCLPDEDAWVPDLRHTHLRSIVGPY